MAALLFVCGYLAADLAGIDAWWVYLPLVAGLAVYLLAGFPGRIQGMATLLLVLAGVSGSFAACRV